MILYDKTLPVSLEPFGILIPIRDSRATKTFEALATDPATANQLEHWHIEKITERFNREDLLRVHTSPYVERLHSSALESVIVKTYELVDADGHYNRYDPGKAMHPLPQLFERILIKAAGSAQCARIALDHGFCYAFSGGMHHAHADHGSGFCLVNDIVLAARKMQAEKHVERVWIIDVDAHKGDGTAAITHGDDTIRTLSVHMAHGWPLDGDPIRPDGTPNPAFVPSDIDIPITADKQDDYCEKLDLGLSQLAAMGSADLAIVVHGADPYAGDTLPSTQHLTLTQAQMLERDQLVYRFLQRNGTPSAWLMAGGYGETVWQIYAQFLKWVMQRTGTTSPGT